jgi:hypothetical protein
LKVEKELNVLTLKNNQNETSLKVFEMSTILWWHLVDRRCARIFSKVYWNKETQVVYVDAAGLPETPKEWCIRFGF